MITFLTEHDFYKKISIDNEGAKKTHWASVPLGKRWDYHEKTINIVKTLDISSSEKVLEIGTMGVQCVCGSTTLDLLDRWKYKVKIPDIVHDLRTIPWPLHDKQFELLVALRVFQHLAPFQRECFLEATRVAEKIILVVPAKYDSELFPESQGINYSDFVEFLDGTHPRIHQETALGDLYFWDLKASKVGSDDKSLPTA